MTISNARCVIAFAWSDRSFASSFTMLMNEIAFRASKATMTVEVSWNRDTMVDASVFGGGPGYVFGAWLSKRGCGVPHLATGIAQQNEKTVSPLLYFSLCVSGRGQEVHLFGAL